MQVTANGIRIEVDVQGEGPPLLLIMGIGAQMMHWPQGLIDALVARGFQCVRFDNRDMGLSQRMSGRVDAARLITRRMLGLSITAPYTLTDMARDSAGVLDALGIESAHVVGASMGGMIAQRLAIETPTRLRTLTSIMSSAGRRRDALTSVKAARALLKQPVIDNAEDYVVSVREFLDAVGSPEPDRDEAELERVCRIVYERGLNPAGFLRQLAAISADGDRTKALRAIHVPTLVIHGLLDPLLSPAGGRAVADAIPRAQFVGIDRMGHDLPKRTWHPIANHIAEHAAAHGENLADQALRA